MKHRVAFTSGLLLTTAALALVGCIGSQAPKKSQKTVLIDDGKVVSSKSAEAATINETTKFSSAEYGVKGSPRVSNVKRPRKGGGRYQVGKAYTIRGKTYYPKEDKDLRQVGLASWYGPNFHGRLTANGEIYDQYSLSAAHPTLPLPSYARVTNLENGRSLIVRVNDRGPYAHGRVIDLSAQTAKMLDFERKGVAKVEVTYAGRADIDGNDEPFLMASYKGPGASGDFAPGPSGSGTLIAMADTNEGSVSGVVAPVRPAEAINQGFDTNQLAFAGNIPIPTERPTLFEGIPITDNGQPIYRVVTQPIAYVEGGYSDFAGYDEKFGAQYIYVGQSENSEIVLELGLFESDTTLVRLNQLFAGAGVVEQEASTGLMVLKSKEIYANMAFDFAKSSGLVSVRIR